ncbi:hypothetical protein Q7P35_011398 [Cladosporium inversicolor]
MQVGLPHNDQAWQAVSVAGKDVIDISRRNVQSPILLYYHHTSNKTPTTRKNLKHFPPHPQPIPPPPHQTTQYPKKKFTSTTALLALTAALSASVSAEAVCQGYLTDPSDITACADELTLRGNEACTVTGSSTIFCEIGTARIVGVATGTPIRAETSSSCIDIAVAVGHILDQCTKEVGGIGWRAVGVEQTNGNPDIYVHALLTGELTEKTRPQARAVNGYIPEPRTSIQLPEDDLDPSLIYDPCSPILSQHYPVRTTRSTAPSSPPTNTTHQAKPLATTTPPTTTMRPTLILLTAALNLASALPLLEDHHVRAADDSSIRIGPIRGQLPDLTPVVNFPIDVWQAGENTLDPLVKDPPVDVPGLPEDAEDGLLENRDEVDATGGS